MGVKLSALLRPVCAIVGHRFEPVGLFREECDRCDLARHPITHQLYGSPRWFVPKSLADFDRWS